MCILIILFGHPISEPLLFGEFPHFMSLQGHCCPPAVVDTGSDRNESSQQPLQPGHRPSPGPFNSVPTLDFNSFQLEVVLVEFIPSLSAAGSALWHRGGHHNIQASMDAGAEISPEPICRVILGVAPDCLPSGSVILLPTNSLATQCHFRPSNTPLLQSADVGF